MRSSCFLRTMLWLVILFISLELVFGARVGGRAYNGNYTPLSNVLVEVTSHPKQSFVSRDGYYEFTLTPGRYEISAFHRLPNGTTLYTTKEVYVSGSGEYIVDLILDRVFSGEPPQQTLPLSLRIVRVLQENYRIIVIGIVALVGLLIVGILLKHRVRGSVKAPIGNGLDDVIQIVKGSGGRITQKELRKQLPSLSEAKVSLMISELEAKGYIEKIKKGRGNIIVLRRGQHGTL